MGLFDPLYYLVSWVLATVHSGWSLFLDPDGGAAWGLSIVVLVVIIRILLIPLFVKQIRSQRAMQAISPRMQALQAKYKDDRQKLSEEMQKLWKETGTNPFQGCLPLLAQAPVFFALFHVLQYVVARNNPAYAMTPELVESARSATIAGAPLPATFLFSEQDVLGLGGDPSATKILCVVLIVVMTATTFITQRQIMLKNVPNTGNNPYLQQQKILLYVLPLIFAFSGVNFPIGVLLYWLTTNLWTMGQQFYVIRNSPTPGTAAYAAWEARRREKKKKSKSPPATAAPAAADPADAADASTESAAPKQSQRVQPRRQTKSKRSAPGGPRQRPPAPRPPRSG